MHATTKRMAAHLCMHATPEEAGEIIEKPCDVWTVKESEKISESVEWSNPQRFGRKTCSMIEILKKDRK